MDLGLFTTDDVAYAIGVGVNAVSSVAHVIVNTLLLILLHGSPLILAVMLIGLCVWTISELGDMGVSTNAMLAFERANSKTRMVLCWAFWLPLACWTSSLVNLAINPTSSSVLSEEIGVLAFAGFYILLGYMASINAVRGLVVRTSKANLSRVLSTGQTVSIWLPTITLISNAYIRMMVAELEIAASKDPSNRDSIINASNVGVVLRRPVEGALVIALATIGFGMAAEA
eukprot:5613593-Amphidinium_carterae.1